jgi:hypothetical protein
MFLPLGTKVDILFLTLNLSRLVRLAGTLRAEPTEQKISRKSAGARAKTQGLISPTAKQICSREDCGGLALVGL